MQIAKRTIDSFSTKKKLSRADWLQLFMTGGVNKSMYKPFRYIYLVNSIVLKANSYAISRDKFTVTSGLTVNDRNDEHVGKMLVTSLTS